MKKLLEKVKSGEPLSESDYQKIKEQFESQLGTEFDSLGGLEPNYSAILKQDNANLIEDLSAFRNKIPHLRVISDQLSSATTTEELVKFHDQLRGCFDILASKKPLKIKTAIKRLKDLSSADLRSQVSDFISGYYLEKGDPLTSYNDHLLSLAGLNRLAEVSKLLPSEGSEATVSLPKSASLKEYAAADHSRTYPVSLQRCLKFCSSPALAAKLLGGVILRGQAEGIGKFKGLSARETLDLLAKVKGADYTILTQVDFRGYSSHVVQEEEEEDDEFEGGIEIDEEEINELFPEPRFQELLKQFRRDRNGGVLLTSTQAGELYQLWSTTGREGKILTNPLNILQACIAHPDYDSMFCEKYTLLLSLWLNSHFPGSVNLRPVPQTSDLLDILADQLESIENIMESFSFFFHVEDLPLEYFVNFRLDELIMNREKLGPLLPASVKHMIAAVMSHPKLVHKTEAFGIILERTVTAGHLQAELTSKEARLLHEYMDFYGLADQRFFEEFDRLHGSGNIYNFDESSSDFLVKFVVQIKKLGQNHKYAEFDTMDPVEVLGCLQFIQTLDGGARLMQFIARKLLDSSKYGELFSEILSKSRSVADALNKYMVYLDDLLNGGHKPAALVMFLYESDPQLKDLIWEREEYMSAEEILEYLETMHPFKVEAVCSKYYFDVDYSRLAYPRKSQTRSHI